MTEKQWPRTREPRIAFDRVISRPAHDGLASIQDVHTVRRYLNLARGRVRRTGTQGRPHLDRDRDRRRHQHRAGTAAVG